MVIRAVPRFWIACNRKSVNHKKRTCQAEAQASKFWLRFSGIIMILKIPAWDRRLCPADTQEWWEHRSAREHLPRGCRPLPGSPPLCRGWARWSWGGRSSRWRWGRRGKPRRCSSQSCRSPGPTRGKQGQTQGRSTQWSCWPAGWWRRTWWRRSLGPMRRRGRWLHSRRGMPGTETRRQEGSSRHHQTLPPAVANVGCEMSDKFISNTSPDSPTSVILRREARLLSIQPSITLQRGFSII